MLAGLVLGMLTAVAPAEMGAPARWTMVVLALAASGWLWGLHCHAWQAEGRVSKRWVFGVAVALRLAALPLDPVLSDDGYRYVWDGRRVVEARASPYANRPSEVAGMDGALYARLNSKGYYSVYPPVSQGVFATAAWVGRGEVRTTWWAIKALTTLAELVGIAALLSIATPAAVMLYAWHPLAILEIAGQGHTEGLFVGAFGVLAWALGRRPVFAGLATAAAVGVKLWPVAFIPFVLSCAGRRGAISLGIGIMVIALPFASPGTAAHVAESLRLYAGSFDWYAPLYLGLKWLTWPVTGPSAGQIAAGGLTMVWIFVVAGLVVMNDGSDRRRWVVMVTAAYVALSPVLHPWHLLPLLICLPLLQNHLAPVVWLVSLSVATYLRYVGSSIGYSLVLTVGWGGAALCGIVLAREGLLRIVMKYRARAKWHRLAPHIAPLIAGARLLDLGCGEGWVGEAAAEATGSALTLADVVDFNQTVRPLVGLSTKGLPFAADTFQATILSYVLHHAHDPENLINEACRVTSGPVVCLESVVRWNGLNPLLQWIDYHINRIRSNGVMKDQPTAWRSIGEWREVAHRLGYSLTTYGPQGWFHPVAVFVLSSTESTEAVAASSQIASVRRRSHVN